MGAVGRKSEREASLSESGWKERKRGLSSPSGGRGVGRRGGPFGGRGQGRLVGVAERRWVLLGTSFSGRSLVGVTQKGKYHRAIVTGEGAP